MRKSLRLVALVIPMVLVASNSYAAVKAGSACSKVGTKSFAGGKNYTCVKSGKKLVWDKGALVSLAKPTASASVDSYPAAPTSFDDLVANYQGIAYAAWSKSREKIQASKSFPVSLKLVLGPNTQLTYKEPEKPMELVTRLYPGFATNAEIYYLAFNFDDREWAKNQMESIIPNSGSG